MVQDLKAFGMCNLTIHFGEESAFEYYKYKYVIDPGYSATVVFYNDSDDPVLKANVYQGMTGTAFAESFHAITHRGRIKPYLT